MENTLTSILHLAWAAAQDDSTEAAKDFFIQEIITKAAEALEVDHAKV